MDRKKRILMCAEHHDINSGFGRYTKEILQRLSKRDDYEIAEFASYCYDDYTKNVPWKVYPNAVRDDSDHISQYKSNPLNQFGQWRFDKVVLHFKPDIVFDIRDYWMFSYQQMSPLLKYFHWVIGPTIDSIPQKPEWLMTFDSADVVLTHTDWAIDYLKNTRRSMNIGGCVTDSVDTETFRPVSWSKNYHKASFGLPTDSIIIGSVMRNQKRKLISELFLSLRKLIDITDNHKIFLYLHTSYPEQQGWDIAELLQEHKVYNNVLFTYYNPITKKYYPSLFKGTRLPSPEADNTHCIFPNVIHGVDNGQLCEIYNLFDIYVQYAICEGLGIPQLEAASCGVPLFAVNYSGMSEIIKKVNGVPIRYVLSKELETGADRAVPDNNDLVQKIINWINLDKKQKKLLSSNTRSLLVSNYSWDKTADNMMKVFDDLQPKNIWHEPMVTNMVTVPDNLSNREFVDFIIDNILCEPRLKQTHYIQNLILGMDQAIDIGKDAVIRHNVVKSLEIFLNNKIYCEKIRSGQEDVSSEIYLNK